MTIRDAEHERLQAGPEDLALWRKWGPYLSDRSWGTVREDYSADCDPWKFFPHEMARSKAYRWGEDGIAGFSDRYQILCWSMAFWNGRDPILKERFFGVVPREGNHGEDVKECYFYVDATPTHSYQRMVYKYPQAEFPYALLSDENRRRGPADPELELIDTGVFDEGRYFDIEIEIAKETAESMVMRVTAHNRGPERAPIHLIPQLWFRNRWSWGQEALREPVIRASAGGLLANDSAATPLTGLLNDSSLGPRLLEVPEGAELLFTNNETNAPRVFDPSWTSRSPYVKDAFHRFIVDGERAAVNPNREGTKAAAWMKFDVAPGAAATIEMRLSGGQAVPPVADRKAIGETIDLRREEAGAFYAAIHPPHATEDEKNIQRQAFAGMLWNKQSYLFDVDVWLDGDNPQFPPNENHRQGRNKRWRHLNSMRILSMPDKWEYPWFAAWDLAFHSVVFALIDSEYAKEQLWLMLFEQFQHPNGQIPAYEWEFSDLNPPVQAWAVWRVYNMDRIRSGKADLAFLERCFHKLLLNFTWWVNKVDREGNNVFEGGFLGLDNIAISDRSDPFPGGAVLEQSDATGWMGMYSLAMMRIALELARTSPSYEGLATKFFEHYVYIGAAMKMVRGGRTLWDEEDGFFYDLLRFPDGNSTPFRVRSLVGLIPLYAVERLEEQWIKPFPLFHENLRWFLKYRKDIVDRCVTTVKTNGEFTHVLAVVDQNQLQRLLERVVDPNEFLSPFGMRSMSKFHEQHPFELGNASVGYEPAEAQVVIKGGNSNWRGPIWFPTTFLMIETLRKLERAFGGSVKINVGAPAPAPGPGPGPQSISLTGLAARLADRQIRIFVRDKDGYRPVFGPRGTRKAELFARDPHWRDLVLFHEYFNGDTGEGLGASHQTGWTGLVANLIDEWRR